MRDLKFAVYGSFRVFDRKIEAVPLYALASEYIHVPRPQIKALYISSFFFPDFVRSV